MPPPPDPAKLAADWERVRKKFAHSLMVDTKLSSLAQNLERPDWPLPGDGETPSKYLDLTFAELEKMPGLMGFPERVRDLIEILRETQSFDDPFGEMTTNLEAATSKDDVLLRNLARLEVPADFPMRLAALPPDTLAFCASEQLATLADFIAFSQKMAQAVVVGGEFRGLLNALAHTDERALAAYLPFRPGHKGLHLPEALGLGPKRLRPAEFAALLKKHGRKELAPEQEREAARVTRDALAKAERDLLGYTGELEARFKDAFAELRQLVKSGGNLERYLMVVQEPDRELVALRVTLLYLKEGAPGAATAPAAGAEAKPAAPPAKKRGLFGWLFGRK